MSLYRAHELICTRNKSNTTPVLYDNLHYDYTTALAEGLVVECILKIPVFYDILPFTALLVQNFEVSHMTGSTVPIFVLTLANFAFEYERNTTI